jgi:hypothetical protein
MTETSKYDHKSLLSMAEELKKNPDSIARMTLKEHDLYSVSRLQRERIMLRSHFHTIGQYDPELDLSESPNTPFVKLTSPKVQAAIAMEVPILLPPGKECWDIQSPMEPHIKKLEYQLKSKKFPDTEIKSQVFKANQESNKALRLKIVDGLARDNWNTKFHGMIIENCIYGTGIMSGPFAYKENGNTYPHFDHYSWWSIFRDPIARTVEECCSIHVRRVLTTHELIELKKVEGYRKDAIDEVLADYATGNWSPRWWELQLLRGNNQQYPGSYSGRFELIKRWGYLSGKELSEAGLTIKEEDKTNQFMVRAEVIGHKTIYLEISEFHQDRLPFYFSPHYAIPHSMEGLGIPEAMSDSQDAINACERGKMTNLAFVVKPPYTVQTDRVDLSRIKSFDMTAGKMWPVISSEVSAGDPVKPIKFDCHIEDLDNVQARNISFAQEETGIPNFLQGLGGPGTHNRTLGGAQLQFDNAITSIKSVIFNYENYFIIPAIQKTADFFLHYDSDPAIQGDHHVIATGVQGLIARENLSNDLLQIAQIASTNPEWSKRFDPERMWSLLVTSKGLDDDRITFTEAEVKEHDQEAQVQKQALQDASTQINAQHEVDINQKVKAQSSPREATLQAMHEAPDGSQTKLMLIREVLQMNQTLSDEINAAIGVDLEAMGHSMLADSAEHGARVALAHNSPPVEQNLKGEPDNGINSKTV